jgi:hypothetical protein
MRLFFSMVLFVLIILPYVKAQDTLPAFTASLKSNGKVLISWKNSYPDINQISIQRSSDSIRNFTTLITVPDPRIPENGFVDSKASGTKMYYRIFILFPNSKYMFTKSRRAVKETSDQPELVLKLVSKEKPKKESPPGQQQIQVTPALNPSKLPETKKESEEEKYVILPKIDNSRIYYMMESGNSKKPSVSTTAKLKNSTIEVEKILFVKKRDSVLLQLAGNQVRRFSDSIVKQTKDTLLFVNADTILIKPYIEVFKEPKEVYKISTFVFTAKDGNVTIALADFTKKKYMVDFYDSENILVFEIKEVKDAELIIDKTNFGHTGWFRFELYEDGKLKEKNKLLIPRD